MVDWRAPPLPSVKPAYLELADMLGDAIASGDLRPHVQLPTVRDLAETLGLATATVLRGYREAKQRGLIGGTVGRGTFVLPSSEEHSHSREIFAARGFLAPGVYDLRSNVVPTPAEWASEGGLDQLLPSRRQQSALLGAAYMIPSSTEPRQLREAGARWAGLCGVEATAGSIMLAAGGQHAIAAALCAVGGAGTCLAVPEITNSGALMAARILGLHVAPVRTSREGVDPDYLEHVCRTNAPAAFYCAPAAGNPIPTPIAAERRVAIAQIARRHHMWIIEDDAAGPLVDRSIPPLAQQIPDRTLWLASVAQPLGFGFRLAFVRVPFELEAVMQEALRTLAWTGATPGALLAAQALADGKVETVLAGRRAAIDQRHAIVGKVFRRFHYVKTSGVPYIWLETPPGWRTETLHSALMDSGVAVAPAAQFAADSTRTRRGVRISAGALLSREEYGGALSRIVETCAHPGRYRARIS